MIAGQLEIQLMADIARLRQDMDRAERTVSSAMGGVERAAGLATKALGAVGVSVGGVKLSGLIRDAAMLNSRFEQMNGVMEVVARNAGIGSGEVHRYAKEVQSMGITMNESRQTVISMISAQMDLSKASQLARLAQDAAVIGNINSSEALGRLIQGITAGNLVTLRGIGINVQFEQGYRRLAEELGKTVAELSDAERTQARMNVVMDAGAGIAGAYEASMDSAAKQLGSTARYVEDLKVMWGGMFSETNKALVFGYSDALKGLLETTQRLRDEGKLEEWGETIATVLSHADWAAALLATTIAGRLIPAVIDSTKGRIANTAAERAQSAALVESTRVAALAAAEEVRSAAVTRAYAEANLVAAQAAAARTPGFALNAAAMKALTDAEHAATIAANAHTAAQTKAATAAGAHTAAANAHTAATSRLAAAQRVANSAMALVGGPVGVALIAAYGMWKFWDSITTTTKELEKLHETLGRLSKDAVVDAMEAEAKALDGLRDRYERLREDEELRAGSPQAQQNFAALAKQVAEAEGRLRDYASALRRLEDQEYQKAIEDLYGGTELYNKALEREARLLGEVGTAQAEVSEGAQKVLDDIERQITLLGKSAREQAIYNAQLKAGTEATEEELDAIRERAGYLYDQEKALAEAAEAEKRRTKEIEDATNASRELVSSYQARTLALGKTDRQLAIHEALLRASTMATAGAIAAEIEAITAYYDAAEALEAKARTQKEAEEAAEALRRANAETARQAVEDYRDMRNDLSAIYQDVVGDWENAGEAMKRIGKGVALSIAGDFAAALTLDFLGGRPGAQGFSIAGSLLNAGAAGKIISAGVGRFAPGVAANLGLFGNGAVISAAEHAQLLGGATVKTGLAAVPGWGWALGGALVLNQLFNKKSTPSWNAGMLLHGLPGVEGQFSIDPFASGLRPVGFARRADQSEAMQVADTFRALDQTAVDLIIALGGAVNATRDTFTALDERGLGTGLFFGGAGEKGRPGMAIDQQLTMYLRQLMGAVEGVDEELLAAVAAASTAEEALARLAAALDEKAAADEVAAATADRLAAIEATLLRHRQDAIRSMLDQIADMQSMQRDLQMQIYTLMGATPLFSGDGSVASQLQHLQDRRRELELTHREEIRAEEELHRERMRAAESLTETIAVLRRGGADGLMRSGAQYQSLLAAARAGDMGAASSLGSVSQDYLRLLEDSATDELSYRRERARVIREMEELAAQIKPDVAFDPAAANQRLIVGLEAIQAELNTLMASTGNATLEALGRIEAALDTNNDGLLELTSGALEALRKVDATVGLGSELGVQALRNVLDRIEGSLELDQNTISLLHMVNDSIGFASAGEIVELQRILDGIQVSGNTTVGEIRSLLTTTAGASTLTDARLTAVLNQLGLGNASTVGELRSIANQLSFGDSAVIQALTRIHGAVNELPPDMASAMTSSVGAWISGSLQSGIMKQVIADMIPSGSILEDAVNKYLQQAGYKTGSGGQATVDDVKSPVAGLTDAQVRAQLLAIQSQHSTEKAALQAMVAWATGAGVGSGQAARAMGLDQQHLLSKIHGYGIHYYAMGGIADGPLSGYPAILHGTEAVVPLPDGRSIPVDLRGIDMQSGYSDMATEFRQLREEMASELRSIRAELGDVARSTNVTAHSTTKHYQMADRMRREAEAMEGVA